MRSRNTILACAALAGIFGVCPVPCAAEASATQPGEIASATQPSAATTQPTDLKTAIAQRHKQLDERCRQTQYSLRSNQQTRYADTPILNTFKPEALVSFSLSNGVLDIQTTDLATAVPARVAVEGSNAVFVVSHPTAAFLNAGKVGTSGRPYFSIYRFDFDGKDDQPWQSRLLIADQRATFFAQSIYGTTNLTVTPGAIKVRVSEYTQMGLPATQIYTGQAATLPELRARQPEEFRQYVLPVLTRFCDASFFLPGAADIYSAFVEIPADQKMTGELGQIITQLDADDPADREAASAKLVRLGAPGVLAAMRLDQSALSEEQKLRLRAFISSSRRRPNADPATARRDKNFLLDCLEFDDPAVRSAAKADLEGQLQRKLDFDPNQTGDAASAADAVRMQLLGSPAKTQPTTQPAPQV